MSFISQTWVLFRKRAIILKNNPWPYIAAVAIPIVVAGAVTLFLPGFTALTCSPTDGLTEDPIVSLLDYAAMAGDIPIGPTSAVPSSSSNPALSALYTHIRPVDSQQAFENYVTANFSAVQPGGFFLGDTPTFAWRADYEFDFVVATQNFLDNNLANTTIITGYQSFDEPWAPSAGKSLQFILYFGLAMSAFPGFFALYVNMERLRNVRALHYSNGVRAGPLWLAYTLFDFILVLFISAIAIIIFVAASNIWYAPGYLFVVFALYGLSATLMAYVVSLFTASQLAAFAFAAGGQCIFFLLYFIADLVILTYGAAPSINRDVLIANYTIGLFFPAGNLLRALLLTFNEFSFACDGHQLPSYPGGIKVYGGPILYLVIQPILLFAFLVAYDSGWRPRIFSRKSHRSPDIEESDYADAEVFAEAQRVDNSTDELRVMHATKAFGSNVAVQNVSFGVPKSQIFALLGPNGAGKSTTIGLIRGDSKPSNSNGEILVENISIINRRAAARANLGVCPQFDAMDLMTAVEHLRFYARARGVRDVEHNVEQVLRAVGLESFKTRVASKLSGGNKRKLSLGIALMGNPSVLLLDEPSSGMDAASKRVMWRTLSDISEGRSLVLTTHSMEEADALADRAGIMAKRMLALGTSDELRKRHGDAYHVHLVHKDAPYTSTQDMDEIKVFIKQTFPDAMVEERVFHGQLRFSVPNDRTAVRSKTAVSSDDEDFSDEKAGTANIITATGGDGGSSISALFAQLEANKENLGFQYYSVSQATLDQVFLSIVTKHNVMEEDYARQQVHNVTRWQKFKKMAMTVYHNA